MPHPCQVFVLSFFTSLICSLPFQTMEHFQMKLPYWNSNFIKGLRPWAFIIPDAIQSCACLFLLCFFLCKVRQHSKSYSHRWEVEVHSGNQQEAHNSPGILISPEKMRQIQQYACYLHTLFTNEAHNIFVILYF